MLFSRFTTCPSCNKKVKKSNIIIIETVVGTRVTCCEDCSSYLKIRRRVG